MHAGQVRWTTRTRGTEKSSAMRTVEPTTTHSDALLCLLSSQFQIARCRSTRGEQAELQRDGQQRGAVGCGAAAVSCTREPRSCCDRPRACCVLSACGRVLCCVPVSTARGAGTALLLLHLLRTSGRRFPRATCSSNSTRWLLSAPPSRRSRMDRSPPRLSAIAAWSPICPRASRRRRRLTHSLCSRPACRCSVSAPLRRCWASRPSRSTRSQEALEAWPS